MIHMQVITGEILVHLRRGWWEITNSAELLAFGDVNMLLDIGIEM